MLELLILTLFEIAINRCELYTNGIIWIFHISSRIIPHAGCYHALLQSFRHFLGNFCDYAVPLLVPRSRNYRANLHLHAETSAVPSANSIVTNDLRVKFRKCWLLPLAMLNRVSCVNESTLLSLANCCHWYIRAHALPNQSTSADPLINYSRSP